MKLQRIKRRRADRALEDPAILDALARDAGLPASWSRAKKRATLRTQGGAVLRLAKAAKRTAEAGAIRDADAAPAPSPA